jgi:hypothetical protein
VASSPNSNNTETFPFYFISTDYAVSQHKKKQTTKQQKLIPCPSLSLFLLRPRVLHGLPPATQSSAPTNTSLSLYLSAYLLLGTQRRYGCRKVRFVLGQHGSQALRSTSAGGPQLGRQLRSLVGYRDESVSGHKRERGPDLVRAVDRVHARADVRSCRADQLSSPA